MDVWVAVGALGSLAAAGVAAWAAHQSRASAEQSNAAARTLAGIERERRHAELTPRFRVSCELWGPGTDKLRLRVMLLGPPGLDRLDGLTVTIRDDHFLRGEGTPLAAGPTREQIRQQIWGPYRFTPGTGPGEARADEHGRTTECGRLPAGEELPFQLEQTRPPPWAGSTPETDWLRERGAIVRLTLTAWRDERGSWTVPLELNLTGIRVGAGGPTVDVP